MANDKLSEQSIDFAVQIINLVKQLKEQRENYYEEYAQKVIGRAYFIILNKIDEHDGTNERLLEYYQKAFRILSKTY